MRGQRAGQGRPRRWGLGADPEARRGAGGGGGRGCQRKCPSERGYGRENMGTTQVAQWHGSALGAEFDHSPMAPPIVHPSNGVSRGLSRGGWEFSGLRFRG